MKLEKFNSLGKVAAYTELEKCCGSSQWIKSILAARPYITTDALHQFSDKIWSKLNDNDFLEAFTHHPQIGDIDTLKKKFANTAHWAGSEQQGTSQASIEVLNGLKTGNDDYLKKFGFIFIVCATGKTAKQMLNLLTNRIVNEKAKELNIAATEQNKITHLRLNKLFEL